ncbi:MAG: hypothetical protein AB1671_05860 [Thermodesulfobacteriota bacterium]
MAKWWAASHHDPTTNFTAGARAPHTPPQQPPPAVERAGLRLRQLLEAGQTVETTYGVIGHRAIRAERERLGLTPLPALATSQRGLARHGLTRPRGASADTAY